MRRTKFGARLSDLKGRFVRMDLAVVVLVFLAVSTDTVSAQQSEPVFRHPVAKEAIDQIRSPFCPGLMLDICPTATAEALRDSLDVMAREGLSADSLVELVIANHGEEWRAYPKRSGVGLFAWIMPPAILILGLGLVVMVLRRSRESEGVYEGAEPISDEAAAMLEAALADLEDE